MKALLTFSKLLICTIAFSQLNYTQEIYSYDSTLNINYGLVYDYQNRIDTLKMDIYKPIGDNNCNRPAIILLHGGAWVVGNKEDESIKRIARKMAKMGWVVSAINYRLGTHKASSYSMYLLCSNSLSEPCAYNCDTAEAIRASYRAMQDAKGAVRFLKNRCNIDSTDVNNVFMAGESAGAYTSFLVAFMDNENEKPNVCYNINDAPEQSQYFNNSSCVHLPISKSRGDLGPIEGTTNLGTYNSEVKGIGSFFGGVFDISIFNYNNTNPCIYLFAQGSDIIVDYNYNKLFGRIDSECYNNFMCKNYDKYPYCYGGKGLKNYFEQNTALNITYQADIVENYSLNNNCFNNGHLIDDHNLRIQNMANFFAEKIYNSGNIPSSNCITSSLNNYKKIEPFKILKSFTSDYFTIECNYIINENTNLKIFDNLNKEVKSMQIINKTENIDISNLESGIYNICIFNNNIKKIYRIVKL